MLTPEEIADKTTEVGIQKSKLTAFKMLLLGILAGMFIALAGAGSILGNVYGGKLIGALIFPIGLIMVVIAGSELFTGNNLMIIALLRKKITLRKLLKNWLLVYIGNFVGAAIIALLAVYSGVLNDATDTVVTTATNKIDLSFIEALIRGILCNVLVCLAVWMAAGAKTMIGKIAAIFGPIMLFVLCGFEHSVANMFYGPAGIIMSARSDIAIEGLSAGSFLLNNLLPVTIGNIIGGAGIVGCSYFLIYSKKNKPSRV